MPTARQLEIFLAAAQSSSFCKAAETLGISQPGISKQMHSLEQQVGGRLFVRHRGTSAKLTGLGEELFVRAQELLELQRQMRTPQGKSVAVERPVVLVRPFLLDRIKHQLTHLFPADSPILPKFKVFDEARLAFVYLKSNPDAFHLLHTSSIPNRPEFDCSVLRIETCGLYVSPDLMETIGGDAARIGELHWILPMEAEALTHWTSQCLMSLGIPKERMIPGTQFMEISLQQTLEGQGGAIFMDRHVATYVEQGSLLRLPQAVGSLYLVLASGKSADIRSRQALTQKFLSLE